MKVVYLKTSYVTVKEKENRKKCAVFKNKLSIVSRNLIAFILPYKIFKPYLPSLYIEDWKVVTLVGEGKLICAVEFFCFVLFFSY